jgi:hypothetical protein
LFGHCSSQAPTITIDDEIVSATEDGGACILAPGEISRLFTPVVERLRGVRGSWAFMKPVQELWPDVSDYEEHVHHPMDLGTVLQNLTSMQYSSMRAVIKDVRLTFSNALLYNGKQSDVGVIVGALEVGAAVLCS